MAKSLPTSHALIIPELAEYAAQDPIDVSDFQTVADMQHYLSSRSGNKVVGPVFDPPATTASVTFTAVNDTGENLDRWEGVSRSIRPGDAGALIEFFVWGSDVECELTILDGVVTVSTITVLCGATMDCYRGSVAFAHDIDQELEYLVEFRDISSGELLTWHVNEKVVILGTDLPTS